MIPVRSSIFLDAHVHLYPFYSMNVFCAAAWRHMQFYAPDAAYVLCLAERHDCHFFQEMVAGSREPLGRWVASPALDGQAAMLRSPSGHELLILPGRQIVTAERLEITGMLCDAPIEDGQPARVVLEKIRQYEGIPALNWAPGKWWGARGRLVRKLIKEAAAGELVLCDASLRPYGWGEPALMKKAAAKGIKILAGSDPLPFHGDERQVARYGVWLSAPWDRDNPRESLRNALRDPQIACRRTGKRNHWPTLLHRLFRNALAKKQPV